MVKKDCYGILEKVFPMGREGHREVPPECFQCPDHVHCLKNALGTQEGLEMRAELLKRTPANGLRGRLRRWSEKKTLSRLRDRKKHHDR